MQTIIAHVEAKFLYKELHQFSVNSDFGHLIQSNKPETSLSPGAEQRWYLPPRPVTLPDGAITRGNPPPGAFQTSDWAFPYATIWLKVRPLSPDWNKLEISADATPGFEDCLTKLMAEVRRFCPIEASQPQVGWNGEIPPHPLKNRREKVLSMVKSGNYFEKDIAKVIGESLDVVKQDKLWLRKRGFLP